MTWKHSTHATAKHTTVKHFKEIGEKWKHTDYFSSSPKPADNFILLLNNTHLPTEEKSVWCHVFHEKTKILEQFINVQRAMSSCVPIPASGWITQNSIFETDKLHWKNCYK
jgi:hypothetical protein